MQKMVIYERGFIHDKVPNFLFNELLEKLNLDDISSKPNYNHGLAGNIEIEKGIDHLISSNFRDYLAWLANQYCSTFSMARVHYSLFAKMKKEFHFMSTWLNYQKKHEFNPAHDHGGDLSYVMWLKIPYDLESELSLENANKSNSARNSMFEFIGNDFSYEIPVSKQMEGDIIMFDSRQRHLVYPFYTSDEYRISMSGNINIKIVD